MILNILFPVVIVLIVGFIFYRVFGGVFKQMRNSKKLAQTGTLGLADVVSVSQTGTTVNNVPEMRVVLDVENAGAPPRRVEIKQLIDLGAIPRSGDRVYVLIHPNDPSNVVLSPMSSGSGARIKVVDGKGNQTGTLDMESDQVKDIMTFPPGLRERGIPSVAKIVSVEQLGNNLSRITLDQDSIGKPYHRVVITQRIEGFAPPVGARVYIIYDPQNPDTVALVPASMTQGQTLGVGTNRLDALVLGPQLLHEGAKASAKVLSAKSIPMASPVLAAQGFSKWEMVLEVTPLTPSVRPYQANLTISLTSKEKADKIAYTGAVVPVRYDPMDLQTISIDSIAMGYPDPYETAINAFKQQMAKM